MADQQYDIVDDFVETQMLLAIVKQHFPTEQLYSKDKLAGGLFNTSYLITLSNAEKFIFRIAPDPRYLFSYECQLMRAEKWAYDLCSNEGLPVPLVIAVGELCMYHRVYMITSFISGVSLHTINIPVNEKADCYYDAGRFMAQMHSISGKRFGRLALQLHQGGFDTWSSALLSEVEEWIKMALPLKLLPNEMYTSIEKVFEENIPVLNRITTPYLAHGDLWSGNILADIQNGKCCFKAIIDADRAIFGDPDFDFSGGKMLNEAFELGYGRPLDDSEDAFIRRRLYLLLFCMRQCYVYDYFLHDHEKYQLQYTYISQILQEFM